MRAVLDHGHGAWMIHNRNGEQVIPVGCEHAAKIVANAMNGFNKKSKLYAKKSKASAYWYHRGISDGYRSATENLLAATIDTLLEH